MNLVIMSKIEFVPKRKQKKDMNSESMLPINIIKKMLVNQENNLVNNKNMILMNIGVQSMFYKRNTLYKLFVAIQLNAVDHGVRIILKYFLIDFYLRRFHLSAQRLEFEWQKKIIKKDNFMGHYFKEFNITGLLFNIHRFPQFLFFIIHKYLISHMISSTLFPSILTLMFGGHSCSLTSLDYFFLALTRSIMLINRSICSRLILT